ncbi:MAG TPA: DUF3500 domain-containing protein [Bryobacteraceae bacterium]|jgi:hypothetical protein|nr:DUF3500 domain-containing protein [Bryobacteraceae bacterium]
MMKFSSIKTACSVAALALICLSPARAQENTPTSRIVSAANTFLATLDQKQRQAVLFSFDDQEQRKRWSNFPTGFVPRSGINLKEMSSPQRDAVMALLATVLSPMGLEKVNQIRLADDDFKANGSKRGPRGGGPRGGTGGPPPSGPGGPPPQFGGRGGPGGRPPFAGGDMFGKDRYYISFLGNPSATAPWMLQFGGHHLALNITIAGSRGVLTPTLTGAQPATFKLNGQTIRPLGRESDKALALLQSLDEKQRQQAVLNYRVPDLVLGPGQDGEKIALEGLKVSGMNDKQRAMLLDLIGEWAGIINENSASVRMAELRDELNETWFAWSGPTTFQPGTNITAYYRVQGPHLVIEYAPQNDEPANHVHTIYRDPTNDYGRQFSNQ